MRVRLLDREIVDGRPRLTIQTKRWWQWSWRTEVWMESYFPRYSGGHAKCWYTADGSLGSEEWDARLSRICRFAENEEKRTAALLSAGLDKRIGLDVN